MADWTGWQARLRVSRLYYRDLLQRPDDARAAFAADFGNLAPLLARCQGRVLDIGGGNGWVRPYLPPTATYVNVEPDAGWHDPAWNASRDEARGWQPAAVVRGVGEHLPFPHHTFDAALSLFSLNHCADPALVLAEVARVLRPGGRAILALEDMEPTWADLRRGAYADWRGWHTPRVAWEKAIALVRGWPREADHVAIQERALRSWCAGLSIAGRQWRGPYLTYELSKPGAAGQ